MMRGDSTHLSHHYFFSKLLPSLMIISYGTQVIFSLLTSIKFEFVITGNTLINMNLSNYKKKIIKNSENLKKKYHFK